MLFLTDNTFDYLPVVIILCYLSILNFTDFPTHQINQLEYEYECIAISQSFLRYFFKKYIKKMKAEQQHIYLHMDVLSKSKS